MIRRPVRRGSRRRRMPVRPTSRRSSSPDAASARPPPRASVWTLGGRRSPWWPSVGLGGATPHRATALLPARLATAVAARPTGVRTGSVVGAATGATGTVIGAATGAPASGGLAPALPAHPGLSPMRVPPLPALTAMSVGLRPRPRLLAAAVRRCSGAQSRDPTPVPLTPPPHPGAVRGRRALALRRSLGPGSAASFAWSRRSGMPRVPRLATARRLEGRRAPRQYLGPLL